MKKRLIIIAVIILIAAFVTIGIIGKNKTKLIKVSPVEVTLEDFKREVSANGEIISGESVQIVSLVTGKINKVHIEAGDVVKKGDILLEVEHEDMTLQYQNSLATLEATRRQIREELFTLRTAYTQALTGFEQAERDYLRTEELHKIGSASNEELRLRRDAYRIAEQSLTAARQRVNFREGRELEDPRTEVSTSDNERNAQSTDEEIIEGSTEVKQARLSVRTFASTLENYTFRAAIPGVVTTLTVEDGGVLSAGALIATIHNTDDLEVLSYIDEVDLSFIDLSQETRIESDSFIGRELEGRVKRMSPIIRKIGDSRVCEIKVSITGDEENLAVIGASCSIFILVEEKNGVPSIPVEAYSIEDGEKYVWVLEETEENGIFLLKKQIIETGILGIETVEVISGLNPEMKIVASKVPGLSDGMEVELEEESVSDDQDNEEDKD
ncbi:MAG: HlyD family efflux transporter periplasmic adaptor subunit [Spirochaetales bacterium]|nr:HlyD family efflux transporter periplasmic adaptor subunit [Spirochaetales bacterium]